MNPGLTYEVKIETEGGLSLYDSCAEDDSVTWGSITGRTWYSRDYGIWGCNSGGSSGTGRIKATLTELSTKSSTVKWSGTIRISASPTPTPTPTNTPRPTRTIDPRCPAYQKVDAMNIVVPKEIQTDTIGFDIDPAMVVGRCNELEISVLPNRIADDIYSATIRTSGSISLNKRCTSNSYTKPVLYGNSLTEGEDFLVPIYGCDFDNAVKPYSHGTVSITLNTSQVTDPNTTFDIVVVPYLIDGFSQDEHSTAAEAGTCILALGNNDSFGLDIRKGKWSINGQAAHYTQGRLLVGLTAFNNIIGNVSGISNVKTLFDLTRNPGSGKGSALVAMAQAGLSHSGKTHCALGLVVGYSSSNGKIDIGVKTFIGKFQDRTSRQEESCPDRFREYKGTDTACFELATYLDAHISDPDTFYLNGDYKYVSPEGEKSGTLSLYGTFPYGNVDDDD